MWNVSGMTSLRCSITKRSRSTGIFEWKYTYTYIQKFIQCAKKKKHKYCKERLEKGVSEVGPM